MTCVSVPSTVVDNIVQKVQSFSLVNYITTAQHEADAAEDVCLACNWLKIDDDSLHSCVGVCWDAVWWWTCWWAVESSIFRIYTGCAFRHQLTTCVDLLIPSITWKQMERSMRVLWMFESTLSLSPWFSGWICMEELRVLLRIKPLGRSFISVKNFAAPNTLEHVQWAVVTGGFTRIASSHTLYYII